jgi:transcriptional regulator with XRE-family HTH domain
MSRHRIMGFRRRLGLSQTQLACRAGMAQGTLSDLENGKRAPWPAAIARLSQALNVDPGELFPHLNKG